MKKIFREQAAMIDLLQKLYPLAEVNILHTRGKHHLKLVIELHGSIYKAPLSVTPGDRNWLKQAIRQVKRNISKEL